MASVSYLSECPNCGEEMDSCTDNKPFDYTQHWCKYCGFYVAANSGQMTLDELNEMRKDWNENAVLPDEPEKLLPMLDKLPEMDQELVTHKED